jgi:sec-independent protein translocase protein TatB
MLDIGWMELLVIGVIALIVVGPKDLPVMFRAAGQFMGKARGMAREFQPSMEDAAKESGLSESAKQLNSLSSTLNTKLNLTSATSSARRYAENVIKEGEAKSAPASATTTPPSVAEAAPAAPEVAAPSKATRKAATPKAVSQKPEAVKAAAAKPTTAVEAPAAKEASGQTS